MYFVREVIVQHCSSNANLFKLTLNSPTEPIVRACGAAYTAASRTTTNPAPSHLFGVYDTLEMHYTSRDGHLMNRFGFLNALQHRAIAG